MSILASTVLVKLISQTCFIRNCFPQVRSHKIIMICMNVFQLKRSKLSRVAVKGIVKFLKLLTNFWRFSEFFFEAYFIEVFKTSVIPKFTFFLGNMKIRYPYFASREMHKKASCIGNK